MKMLMLLLGMVSVGTIFVGTVSAVESSSHIDEENAKKFLEDKFYIIDELDSGFKLINDLLGNAADDKSHNAYCYKALKSLVGGVYTKAGKIFKDAEVEKLKKLKFQDGHEGNWKDLLSGEVMKVEEKGEWKDSEGALRHVEKARDSLKQIFGGSIPQNAEKTLNHIADILKKAFGAPSIEEARKILRSAGSLSGGKVRMNRDAFNKRLNKLCVLVVDQIDRGNNPGDVKDKAKQETLQGNLEKMFYIVDEMSDEKTQEALKFLEEKDSKNKEYYSGLAQLGQIYSFSEKKDRDAAQKGWQSCKKILEGIGDQSIEKTIKNIDKFFKEGKSFDYKGSLSENQADQGTRLNRNALSKRLNKICLFLAKNIDSQNK